MSANTPTPKRTARDVIDTLCVPIGERASAWASKDHDDHDDRTVHAGFASPSISQTGYEFADWLGVNLLSRSGAHVIGIHEAGDWPYTMYFEAPTEHAVIEYCEGDVAVTVYKTPDAFAAAVAKLRAEDC